MHGEGAAQIGGEPDVQHLAPLCLRRSFEAGSVCARGEPPLVAAHTNEVRVPAVDRTARCRPEHAAGHAEHGAHEHRPAARLVRIDQGFGSARVEDAAIGAVAAMLGVQVADGVVARGAPCEVRVEAACRSCPYVSPTQSGASNAGEQPRRGTPLPGCGKLEVGVLAEVMRETAKRFGSECRLPGLQRAQQARRCCRRRDRHPDEEVERGGETEAVHIPYWQHCSTS